MSTSVHTAQSYLNFRGDISRHLHIGQAMGPATYGAWQYVVSFDYEPDLDRTVVGMSAVNPLGRP